MWETLGRRPSVFDGYQVLFSLHLSFRLTILGLSTTGELQKKFPPAWKREGIGWPRTSGEGARHARPVKPSKKIIAQMFAFVKGLRRKKRNNLSRTAQPPGLILDKLFIMGERKL